MAIRAFFSKLDLTIFKDNKWPWKKSFSVENLMERQIFILKLASLWPTNWFLRLQCLITNIMSIQITIYYIITFILLILNKGNIIDITDAVTSAIIYSFVFFVQIYFQYMNSSCIAMITFMAEKFRMRSTKGYLLYN